MDGEARAPDPACRGEPLPRGACGMSRALVLETFQDEGVGRGWAGGGAGKGL